MEECLLSPTSDPFNPFFSPLESPHPYASYHSFGIISSTSEWHPDPVYLQQDPKSPRSQRSMSSGSSGSSCSQDSGRRFARSLSPIAVLPNYKTEFCNKFQEVGYCPFGDQCQFVHEFHELQKRGRALTYKTQACWSRDNCRYQQNRGRCIYLHGDETAEMFDQHRGISYARVQKILMNKELRQEQQQHKGGEKKQQGQDRQRHHSTESSVTDFSSRAISTEPSSPPIRPVNQLSILPNTSSWPSSWNIKSSVVCESPVAESYLGFKDPFDGLLDSLAESTTEHQPPPQMDQAPSLLRPVSPVLPDMAFSSSAWPLPHLDSRQSSLMLDVAYKFSPFDTSPLIPTVAPASIGAHNGHGGTGLRSVAHVVTDLPVPPLDHYPPSDLLSPGIMSDIDLPYMAQGRLHEWQDPCFEDEESFSPPIGFDRRHDLLSRQLQF
ncbi:hypothetical protein BG000_004711 [Podila horticola]|nr:hypothetical protein BG000_004711 [Podila horticola]